MNRHNVFVKSKAENSEDTRATGKSLATVVAISEEGVQLRLDGEPQPRQKAFRRLASYGSPQAGDRVYIAEVSGTFIVFGKII